MQDLHLELSEAQAQIEDEKCEEGGENLKIIEEQKEKIDVSSVTSKKNLNIHLMTTLGGRDVSLNEHL